MFTPDNTVLKNGLTKLTAVMRSLFDTRTQSLIEAGYITECAQFTAKYDNAMRVILLAEYGDKLEEVAKAEIAESLKTK